jgi:hypothetical protein
MQPGAAAKKGETDFAGRGLAPAPRRRYDPGVDPLELKGRRASADRDPRRRPEHGCMAIARGREAERVLAMTPRERVLLALSLAHRLDAWAGRR